MEALGSKRIWNTLKKGIKSAMECTDVAVFTFAVAFSLQVYILLGRSDGH